MTDGQPADHDTRVAWLRLAGTEGVGPASFFHLLRRYGSAPAALDALPELSRRPGLRIPSSAEAHARIERAARIGALPLLACDPAYPSLLAHIDGAPPVLWVLGDPAVLARDCIAIVGSRAASASGRRFARELAAALGEAGWVVVSGLARGIDAAAHLGSLATGAVAVLAGGIDEPYPPENRGLYDAMARNGCVVSEREPGHVARAPDFPRRNRIISGLALGVVVVEAELRSGSLITARLAGEQGREVFAVPGSPYEPRARGANDLIRLGATLVESAEDVLAVVAALPHRPASAPEGMAAGAPPSFSDDLFEAIDALLSPTPVSLDELARASGAPISAVTAALVELSLLGRAELVPGGMAQRPG